MKKLLLLTPALLLLAGCGKSDETIRLRYSVFFPSEHIQAKLAQSWADEIASRSDGRVKITIFPAGALTKAENCFQGVIDGNSHLGMSAFAYTRGRFPLLQGLDLPHGYPDGVAATRVANQLIAEFKPAELDDVHFLYVHAHGPGILATRRGNDVKTLDDLKGKNIRATGFVTDTVSALGGNPVGMPQNDTYEALQKGTVDATFCPVETLKGWNQGQVIDAITDTRCVGYTTTFFVVMNKQKWESLPADIQKIFTNVSREWVGKHGEAWNTADEDGRAFIATLGRQTFALDAAEQARWRAAIQPVIDKFIEGDTPGLPRRAFIAKLHDLLDK